MPDHRHARVVVVGAGITGLTTAYALGGGGDVVVVEAADRAGGQIRTEMLPELGGVGVDVGAESIHLGLPQVAGLVESLGLTRSVVEAEPGASRLVTSRGLRPLPFGVGPIGPSRLGPLVFSGLLSPGGLLRAAMEPLAARRPVAGDISVGAFVRQRFGDEVADVLVDPLLGNLHAGDIDRLSLASVAPRVLPAARAGRSLLRHTAAAPAGPMFASWPEGLSRLTDALAERLDVRLGEPAVALHRRDRGWAALTEAGEHEADRVVLAVPAAAAARLVSGPFPELADEVSRGRVADVATIVLGYPWSVAHRLPGNGLLLRTDSGRLVKAATWLSHKWARLAGGPAFCVRASIGRAGADVLTGRSDDELAARVHAELAELTGVDAAPLFSRVTRWPGAFPQLEVGHAARIAGVRTRLRGTGLYLAGAAFDGLGLAATVRSAFETARKVTA